MRVRSPSIHVPGLHAHVRLARALIDWRAPAASVAVAAGYIVDSWGSIVAPVDLLIRPLLVGVGLALVVGLLAGLAGRHAVPLAAVIAAGIAMPEAGLFLGLVWLAAVIAARLLRRPARLANPALAIAAIYALLAVVGSVPAVELHLPGVTAREATPTYVVLLDGYPRADELAERGIDVSEFLDALERRGFDHYPDATSQHRWTDLTLAALLAGTTVGIPDEATDGAYRRQLHRELAVPEGFVAIGPPVAHVVMRGPRLDIDSVTDFEAHLIGRSMGAAIARDQLLAWIMGTVDGRVDRTLDRMAEMTGPVFAHVMSPHPPFRDGPDCWPDCQLFEVTSDQLGIPTSAWWDRLADRVEMLNRHLLVTVDRILADHPDATIVLFSDHGGRPSDDDPDEWHRTLLVARTPGRPGLFAAEPHPDAILRLLQH